MIGFYNNREIIYMKNQFSLFCYRSFLCFILLLVSSFLILGEASAVEKKFNPQIEYATYQNYIVLNLELEFDADLYTYAPNQKDVYPTDLKLYYDITNNVEISHGTGGDQESKIELWQEIDALFAEGEYKPDPLNSKVQVRVYQDNLNIFVLIPDRFINIARELEILFLACSKMRCEPTTLKLPLIIPNKIVPLEELAFANTFLERFQLSNKNLIQQKVQIKNYVNLSKSNLMNNENELTQVDVSSYDIDKLVSSQAEENFKANFKFSPRPLDNSLEVSSLWKALLFGILAGFILNFMPFVLPVIALKINFLFKAESDEEKKRQEVKEYCLFFALGIMLWFIILGFLLAFLGLGLGQIFQNPFLVLGLLVFIFAMGLSLFGIFHLPIININSSFVNKKENKKISAFSTGLLATLLATPCSGPLLGAVLGYSLTQSLGILLTIFLSMGFGMAFPYLLFAIRPSLIKFMPRGGNWMHILEKFLGFFLFGTSIYLFSILPTNWHIISLTLILTTSISLYIWGKWGSFHAIGLKKYIIAIVCLTIFAAPFSFLNNNDKKIVFWENFSLNEFNNVLGQEIILLQFSADWCPTCKVLEQAVFTMENMEEIAEEYDIKPIYVDLTKYDETKQSLLTSLGSVSIPLLAVFPVGSLAEFPIIIRDIYSYEDLKKALDLASEIM